MNIISNDLIHFNSNCQVDSKFWGVFNFPLENSGIAEGVSESISGKDLLVSRHIFVLKALVKGWLMDVHIVCLG